MTEDAIKYAFHEWEVGGGEFYPAKSKEYATGTLRHVIKRCARVAKARGRVPADAKFGTRLHFLNGQWGILCWRKE